MSTICRPRKDKPFMEKKDAAQSDEPSEKPRASKQKDAAATEDKVPKAKKAKSEKHKKNKK